MSRQRLDPAARRTQLLDVGARLFAAKPYDDVLMEDIADQAGVSRALLYRHFPTKRDLFAAVFQQAADTLLTQSPIDPAQPLMAQLVSAFDAHLDYFAANRNAVLAANRTLAGDPIVQAVINDELSILRDRLLGVAEFAGRPRELVSATLMGWLVFVRILCVDWLANEAYSRTELRDTCVGALLGALTPPGEIPGGA